MLLAIIGATTACPNGESGNYIIELSESAARSNGLDTFILNKLGRRSGDTVLNTVPLISAVVATLSTETMTELQSDSDIAHISRDCNIELDPDESVTSLENQAGATWGIDRIDSRTGTDGNYNYDSTGAGAVVYVLDTGIRISHQDFGGRAKAGWSAGCEGGSCSSGYLVDGVIDGDGRDCSGHGTHCAGTIGGTTYGVSKDVELVAVQVLSCMGSGSTSGVLAGIQWAVDDAATRGKPAIISMSLGGGRSDSENRIVDAAHDAGVTVVVAAGNDDSDACDYSPASAVKAITVGSATSSDARSSFSNHGTCVDIFAPGSAITAAYAQRALNPHSPRPARAA